MTDPIRELQAYRSAIKRHARQRADTLANVNARWDAKDAAARESLSPQCRALLEAWEAQQNAETDTDARFMLGTSEPEPPPPESHEDQVDYNDRLSRLMTTEPPDPPTAPIVIERADSDRRVPRRGA